jgi:mannose-6-phosphate isomerase-like protein (cupin superfamily)
MTYVSNVIEATKENHFFRKVIYTGQKSQLVVMEIPVGGDIGEETHEHVEQWLFFEAGSGRAVVDGKEFVVGPGDVVIVTPGARHNFINSGNVPLKIYTVYVPPNHIERTIHETKEDAERDIADEEFGKRVR